MKGLAPNESASTRAPRLRTAAPVGVRGAVGAQPGQLSAGAGAPPPDTTCARQPRAEHPPPARTCAGRWWGRAGAPPRRGTRCPGAARSCCGGQAGAHGPGAPWAGAARQQARAAAGLLGARHARARSKPTRARIGDAASREEDVVLQQAGTPCPPVPRPPFPDSDQTTRARAHVKKISCLSRWMPAPTTSPGLHGCGVGRASWTPCTARPARPARASVGACGAGAPRGPQGCKQRTRRPDRTPPRAAAARHGACARCLRGSPSCWVHSWRGEGWSARQV